MTEIEIKYNHFLENASIKIDAIYIFILWVLKDSSLDLFVKFIHKER